MFSCMVCYRAFDVELLYIAQQLNFPITEVAVNWQEIDGMTLHGWHLTINYISFSSTETLSSSFCCGAFHLHGL